MICPSFVSRLEDRGRGIEILNLYAQCFEPDAHHHTKGNCWLKFTEGPAAPEVGLACLPAMEYVFGVLVTPSLLGFPGQGVGGLKGYQLGL